METVGTCELVMMVSTLADPRTSPEVDELQRAFFIRLSEHGLPRYISYIPVHALIIVQSSKFLP